MIFPRIKRGAQRSLLLVGQKYLQFAERPALSTVSTARRVALHLMVARIITAPIPMHGDIAHAAVLTADDSEPSVVIPLNVAGPLSPSQDQDNLNVAVYTLNTVEPTASYRDLEDAKIAEEARLKAEAEAAAARAAAVKPVTKTVVKATVRTADAAAAARVTSPKLSGELATRIAYLKPYFMEEFGGDWKIAMAIGMAESGLTADRVSRTDDHGLMQIHKGFSVYGAAIYDPIENLRIAARTYYKRRGFQPWTTYKKGTYKKYLHLFN
ncbi:hypothetical protein BH11PAT4_BH11PAT4_2480 [soil metagenome]